MSGCGKGEHVAENEGDEEEGRGRGGLTSVTWRLQCSQQGCLISLPQSKTSCEENAKTFVKSTLATQCIFSQSAWFDLVINSPFIVSYFTEYSVLMDGWVAFCIIRPPYFSTPLFALLLCSSREDIKQVENFLTSVFLLAVKVMQLRRMNQVEMRFHEEAFFSRNYFASTNSSVFPIF